MISQTYAYDSIGNLTSKSDVGTYSYSVNKPHAVTATTGAVNATYTYDANGNLTSGNTRTLAYTSYNMPRLIERGTTGTTFTYDPDRTRTTQTTQTTQTTPGETTVYLNPRWDLGGHYEKTTHSSGIVEYKHYIYGSSGPVALYTLKSDTTSTTRYLHKDHLGSVDTLTSETGTVLERFSYDAFGKRRLPNGTDGAVPSPATHHGYTGHEHLDGLGLIHMNGRVYDPALGRFTQADPYIQDPTHSQSLNRYSYVDNNPLKYTDPSGYKKIWKQKWFKQAVKVVVAVTAAAYTGGAAYNAFIGSAISSAGGAMAITGAQLATATASATITSGIVSGAVAGGIMGNGSLKSIVAGAATGMLFGAVSASGISGVSKVLASGTVGGITTDARGGQFEEGFKMSGMTSSMSWGYEKVVEYKASPLPGESIPGGKYDTKDANGRLLAPQGKDVVGHNESPNGNWLHDALSQGGSISRIGNALPVGNATAAFHDNLFNKGIVSSFTLTTNIATIPPAIFVSYGALIDGSVAVELSVDRSKRGM